MGDEGWVPDACTLPTVEQPLRRAEFDGLFATALTIDRVTGHHLRIVLPGAPDDADRIRDLAARENECCSFFTFTVSSETPERIAFDIEVPDGHVGVLEALAHRATRVRHAGS